MTFPIIGITTYGLNEKGSFHIPATYANCIRDADAIPVLIPPGEKKLTELVETIDGFVFAGGGDIDPRLYGGNQHAAIYGIDEVRDAMELNLARIIIDQAIPTLAICRGLQVFTVAMGGTLKDDILLNCNGQVIHRLPEYKPAIHPVRIINPSRLWEILKKKEVTCASLHHQAVEGLPDNAHISALSADGVIEAVEFDGYDNLIAVQWHPEITANDDPDQQKLFEVLISKAQECGLKRRKRCV
jgi:putative glutamine amidotransferase